MTVASPVSAVRTVKVRPDHRAEVPDHVVTEEPLEIRLAGPGRDAEPVVVTMRTPGNDFDLAAGFVCTERLSEPSAIASVGYCDAVRDDPELRYNTVTVGLRTPSDPLVSRRFGATASCGVCGKSSIEEIVLACEPVEAAPALRGSLVAAMPDLLRGSQKAFDRTGGLHAAGLFDAGGDLLYAREDIGRHNAVDKVIGAMILERARRGVGGPGDRARPRPAGCALMVSGRVSFEIVQKAAVAGIGALCAVSAPSSLAVRLADRLGVGLAGFVRGGSYNVYAHPERFDFDR